MLRDLDPRRPVATFMVTIAAAGIGVGMIVVADRMKATDARVGASLVSIDVLRSLVTTLMKKDNARAFIGGFGGAVRPKSMMYSTSNS